MSHILYLIANYINRKQVVGAYEAIQDLESIRYIRDMLKFPNEADLNAKRYAAALIFSLTYGKRLDDDDKDLDAVIEVLEDFIHDCYPGSHLVDTFPVLDKLPDFLSPWRKGAKKKHARDSKVSYKVYWPPRSHAITVYLEALYSTFLRSYDNAGRSRTSKV